MVVSKPGCNLDHLHSALQCTAEEKHISKDPALRLLLLPGKGCSEKPLPMNASQPHYISQWCAHLLELLLLLQRRA